MVLDHMILFFIPALIHVQYLSLKNKLEKYTWPSPSGEGHTMGQGARPEAESRREQSRAFPVAQR